MMGPAVSDGLSRWVVPRVVGPSVAPGVPGGQRSDLSSAPQRPQTWPDRTPPREGAAYMWSPLPELGRGALRRWGAPPWDEGPQISPEAPRPLS